MPELPIVDERGELSLLAPLITLGIMHFPDDLEAAGLYVTRLGWSAFFDALSEPDDAMRQEVERLGWTRHRWFWERHREGALSGEVSEQAAARRKDGFTAAYILLEALGHGLVDASSSGAIEPEHGRINRIVEDLAAPRRGRSTLMAAWGTFKSVSHLWAALHVFLHNPELRDVLDLEAVNRRLAEEGGEGIDAATHSGAAWAALGGVVAEHLQHFLSVAEAFRLLGESQRTPRQRGTLFLAGEAFAVPAVLGLETAPLEFEVLNRSKLSLD